MSTNKPPTRPIKRNDPQPQTNTPNDGAIKHSPRREIGADRNTKVEPIFSVQPPPVPPKKK